MNPQTDHEGECERCIYRDIPEEAEPCWSCYNNALVGQATGHNFVEREASQ